jgi:hypothetical protein
MKQECAHIELTDEGVCKFCGVDTASQQFMDSLPEVPPGRLGDLVSIVKLAEATAKEYLHHQDPHNPKLPKLCWAGTQLIRMPSKISWADMIHDSYPTAKKLGYRGSLEKWSEVCEDFMELIIERLT